MHNILFPFIACFYYISHWNMCAPSNHTVKPFILGDGLKNLTIKRGAMIKYEIEFKGEPPPEVTWERNSTQLKATDRQVLPENWQASVSSLGIQICIRRAQSH